MTTTAKWTFRGAGIAALVFTGVFTAPPAGLGQIEIRRIIQMFSQQQWTDCGAQS